MYRKLGHVTVRWAWQPPLAGHNCRTIHLKSRPDYAEKSDQPIKFSTSKGGHRRWTVAQSFGSDYKRPWWKVLPVSLFVGGVLLWAAFRKETEIDEIIYRPISELLEEIETSDRNGKKSDKK